MLEEGINWSYLVFLPLPPYPFARLCAFQCKYYENKKNPPKVVSSYVKIFVKNQWNNKYRTKSCLNNSSIKIFEEKIMDII